MTKPKANLDQHLALVASGEQSLQELRLDPTTGELVLAPRGRDLATAPRDGVVIDQIAEDGFFAAPRVVVHESSLQGLAAGQTREAVAVARDEGTVVHVFGSLDDAVPDGTPVACLVARVTDADFAVAVAALETRAAERAVEGQTALAIVISETDRAGALVRQGRAYRCDVSVVPSREALYARSRGLLETDALARRRVGIVGVGSGGSAIAVELAKAGVGHFVLVDPDVLEPANVARHACGLRDIGRLKVHAVRDAILDRNPYAAVETHAEDVTIDPQRTQGFLRACDLIVGATDGNPSRAAVNRAALDLGVTALFGRALTRAAGGDVLRVRPKAGPCLACVFALGGFAGLDEEMSSRRQVDRDAPSYVPAGERDAMVQPGLAADIAPISNMMTRLALLELSRGTDAALASLDEDLAADLYIWANRRERTYAGWGPMGFGSKELSVLRWYGVRAQRNEGCLVCGEHAAGEVVLEQAAPPQWG